MNNLYRGNASIREIHVNVVNPLFGEVRSLVCFIIEPHHSADFEFLEDWDVVVGGIGAILDEGRGTLYLSTVLSEGELNAMNLFGMIQFRSPFSIF
jgi:hypothetical protein